MAPDSKPRNDNGLPADIQRLENELRPYIVRRQPSREVVRPAIKQAQGVEAPRPTFFRPTAAAAAALLLLTAAALIFTLPPRNEMSTQRNSIPLRSPSFHTIDAGLSRLQERLHTFRAAASSLSDPTAYDAAPGIQPRLNALRAKTERTRRRVMEQPRTGGRNSSKTERIPSWSSPENV